MGGEKGKESRERDEFGAGFGNLEAEVAIQYSGMIFGHAVVIEQAIRVRRA